MLHRGVFLTHFKVGISAHAHLSTNKLLIDISVCSPTVLLPVGRKCPQGTPTLRVTVTVFIRRRQAAFSPFAAGGGFPHGRGSPAPFCAKNRDPAFSGKASLPLPKNSVLLQVVKCTANAATCKRSVFCCSTLNSPAVFFTRGAPCGGVLGGATLRLGGVRSTPRRTIKETRCKQRNIV